MSAAPLDPEAIVGERIGGRFTIERPIGAGTVGSTFRARDELLDRRVTVKLFHPLHADDINVVESQLQVASDVARLTHPNIATVIDRGEHDGHPFIVLEYVRGENLQERIDRFAPLAVDEVVQVGAGIARALAYAHAHGVHHGNLRPENVLISEDRSVKLVDFGGGSAVLQLAGDAYCAPETRAGVVEDDVRADIWSLAAVMVVSLTELAPEPNMDAARLQSLRPDVSHRLARTLAQALSASPDLRQASMRELASELSSTSTAAGVPDGAVATDDVEAGAVPDEGVPMGATAAAKALVAVADVAAAARSKAGRGTNGHEAGDAGATMLAPRPVRPPAARPRRSRAVVWATFAVPVIVLLLVVMVVRNEQGAQQKLSPFDESEIPESELVVTEVREVQTFDPAPGDGVEHDEAIGAIIDGDETTTWQTEGYGDEQLGGAKKGVGAILLLDEPADVRRMVIDTPMPGWTVEIYGADLPGTLLDDWALVSDKADVASGKSIEVDSDGHEYSAYLIWISRVVAASDNTHRAEIAEVTVKSVGTDR